VKIKLFIKSEEETITRVHREGGKKERGLKIILAKISIK
jgi:hypothetical protein